MGNLDIYAQYGFKFFECKADKSPATLGDWRDEKNQLTQEQAEKLQTIGRMIGAWIPRDIIVVDVDRHKEVIEGSEVIKIDGAKRIQDFEKKYNFTITDNLTMVVKTGGGGRHLIFCIDPEKEFKQGALKEKGEDGKYHPIGIDIKTNKGYVIAAGSPGYVTFWDNEPRDLPIEFEQFIKDHACVENKKKDNSLNVCNELTAGQQKTMPVKMLKGILNKIDVSKFSNNDRWLQFIMACIAAAGNNEDVYIALEEWSKGDPNYNDDRSVLKRIESFEEIREITVGSFIHFMREENISQYLINQVVKLNSISNILLESESSEINIEFEQPDYQILAQTPAAREFFEIQGNTAGATVLEMALADRVIYNQAEKKAYYFDGNRWKQMHDCFGLIYTVLYRVAKILYNNEEPCKEANDLLYKCVSCLNSTMWKTMTWKEVCSKPQILRPFVLWDSPKIRETITTQDGVIDFTSGQIEIRTGYREEYRKDCFEYTSEEIINAKQPEIFTNFFNDLFLDKSTRETAKYCVSMCITGNSGKRLFQMWEGSGSNGKSTLLETIKHVLGDNKTYSFDSELLLEGTKNERNKPELAQFQGKYFCYAVEAQKGAKLSQNLVKKLSGNDTITARRMYESPISFEATWQLIYAVNDLPAINGDDHAFLSRLVTIPFNTIFYKDEEKKKDAVKRGVKEKFLKKANDTDKFKTSLYSERAGIIKWMIDNYNELNKNLGGVIPESLECEIKKHKYVDSNDDIKIFIDHFCMIDETGGREWMESYSKLAEAFKEFSGKHKMSERRIASDIKKYHEVLSSDVKRVNEYEAGAIRRKQKSVILNIRLKTENEIDQCENERIKERIRKNKEEAQDKEQDWDDKIPF
jgi:P4 family phage/plasmid primase-like protien